MLNRKVTLASILARRAAIQEARDFASLVRLVYLRLSPKPTACYEFEMRTNRVPSVGSCDMRMN